MTPLLSFFFRLPEGNQAEVELVELEHVPEVGLALTMRSGPVVIEIDYDVDPDRARDFYDVMLKVQRLRLRNGAFNWSLSRDIAHPAIWTERYQCPTWGDYLRTRNRLTLADMELNDIARSFNRAEGGLKVRRKLERPWGSVRWKADSPDPKQDAVGYIGPQ